ncbi:MAG: PTS sugar transporter subunit IIA [Candidatus Muiribacteriota bacterium]
MELADILFKENVVMDLESEEKEGIIKEIVYNLHKSGNIKKPENFIKAVLAREKLGSTGIGKGIAIPHGKVEGAEGVIVGLGLSKTGVDFDALDDNPVYCVFLIAASPENSSKYLQTLAKLSRMVRKQEFRDKLIASKTSEEAVKNITEFEEEKN